ncbi:MAG: RidA family protein [Alphaproteobacteria bacterium]|nr:RidA family protein [Alphaproteobacteria bacterium]
MNIQEKVKSLGLALPIVSVPVANYVPYVISGKQIFISGQLPFVEGKLLHQGTVGNVVTLEQGIAAARACALNVLAVADKAVDGDWGRIKRCIKLGGFIACGHDFSDHSKVMNGASDLVVAVLGDIGKHARFAVGAPSLPLGASVEVEGIFELN